jgi:hypothetical protein
VSSRILFWSVSCTMIIQAGQWCAEFWTPKTLRWHTIVLCIIVWNGTVILNNTKYWTSCTFHIFFNPSPFWPWRLLLFTKLRNPLCMLLTKAAYLILLWVSWTSPHFQDHFFMMDFNIILLCMPSLFVL